MGTSTLPRIKFEMKLSLYNSSYTEEVIELFTKVFSESENELEGQVIGNLVSDLIATTESEDLIGFVATSNERIVGCILFSRFIVPSDEVAFILSPVAIATSEQGTGIGQQLTNYGLNHLKSLKVNLAFTYGDPRFYSKVGFSQISESVVKAPYELSQPEGWLAQSLDGSPIKAIQGSSKCVEALSDQKYW
jgi:putative acetyltransferase